MLIIEDNRDHVDLILRAFRSDPEPFRISVAGSIRQAREIAEGDRPDLIISDWNLPDGRGIDILTRTEGTVTTPLIVMTGFGDERLAVEIMKSGAVDYIVKSATVFEDLPNISRRALRFWDNLYERMRAEKDVQESRKRLADILALLPDAVVAIDRDGIVIAWNNAMERLTGVPADAMLGKGDHEYSIPFYGERRPILIDLVLEDNAEIEKRYDYIQRDGDRITSETFVPGILGGKGAYLWGTASPLYDSAGLQAGAIEVLRDITDRKRTEQIIKASEEKFRALVEEVPDLIIVHRNGILLFVNHAAAEATGFPADELLGKSLLDFVLPEYRERISSAIRRRMEGEALEPYEIGIQTRSGVSRQVIIRGSQITFDGASASLNVLTDVTEVRKGELALQVSEDRFRHVSGLITDFAFSCTRSEDGGFRIDWIAGATTQITGYTNEEILAMGCWRDIVVEEDLPVFDTRIGNLLPGTSTECEIRIRTKAQTIRWIICYAECIIDPFRNELYRIYGGCEDITIKKEAEVERERLLATVQEEKEKLSVLLNSIPDEIWFADSNHKFSLVNDQALKEFDLADRDESDADRLLASLEVLRSDGTPRPPEETPTYRALNGETVTHAIEIVRTPAHGDWRYRQVNATPVKDAQGHIMGAVSVVRDITDMKQAEAKLQESNERFNLIARATNDTIWDWDFKTDRLWWSEGITTFFGYREGDIDFTIKTWESLVHPDERERVVTGLERTIENGGENWSDEYRFRKADGTYADVLDRGYILHNAAGEGIRMVGVLLDLTERKAAGRVFAEEAARRRILVDQSRDGIVTLDQDGKVFEANQRFADMLGYSPEEMKDLHVWDWEAVATKEQLEGMIISVNEGGDHFESRHRRKDGTLLDVDISTNAAVFSGRKLIFCVVRDISDKKTVTRALEASEQKFRSLMEYALEIIFILDMEGKILFSNAAAARVLGVESPGELTGRNAIEFVAPDSREHAIHDFEEVARGTDAYLAQYKVITANGEEIYVESIGKVITYEGKPANLVSLRDVTSRVRAEEAVRQNETRFSALIRNSSDIIRVLDRNGLVVYESDSAERILGYPQGFMIKKDPMDFIHPDDLARVKQDLLGVFDRTNTGLPTEFRIRKADGDYIWVESIGNNLLDIPGLNGIIVTTRPIQQRKVAENALRESEERLRLALEGADAGFWDWHLPSGNAVFSDRFYTMLGYEPGEFPATFDAWTDLIHPDDKKRAIPSLKRQLQEGETQLEIEQRIRTKGGGWVWILGRGSVVERDGNGTPIRITGVNLDITNRRLMESEIRSLNAVLEQRVKDRTEALSKANEALEEENAQRLEAESKLQSSLDEKTMLLKEIHHRVKNNLQIIASLLNLQSRYIKDESTLAAIRESQNRVKAMALVHEKLYRSEDLSRIDLNEYLKFLGTGLFQFYDARSRGIRFELDVSVVEVDIGTAIPLGLILNELISNSLKYAFPEGRTGVVAISIRKEDHTLTAQFRDDGVGIPESVDWRETPSLGLRLVNTLVDQLNGTIELDRNAGTHFTMVLHEKQ